MTAKRFDRKNIEQQDEPTIPHRPVSLSYRYENNGDSLTLRQRKFLLSTFPVAGFMTVWLTGWTVGCVLLIWKFVTEPSFFLLCFGIPFWVGWFAGAGVLLTTLFGKNTVRLDHDGLFSTYHVLVKLISKQVPLDEIRYFHAIVSNTGKSTAFSVETVTFGKPVQFSTAKFEEAEWLAYDMNQTLAALKGLSRLDEKLDDFVIGIETGDDRDDTDAEAISIPLNARPQNIEPPTDNSWKLNTEFDSVTFEKRGKFSLAYLALLAVPTFTMLFWNGIVSVFVMTLWGFAKVENAPVFLSGQWWLMFVFLIPFEVFGIGFFLWWLSVLVMPCCRTRWSFHRDMVTCRFQCFGIGRSWQYSLENCDKMVIETSGPDGDSSDAKLRRQINREDELYQLAFVDDQNKKLYSIKKLMLGEACWIADCVLHYR